MNLVLNGLQVVSCSESNNEISAAIGLIQSEFQAGILDANFEAFTGFTEVDGVVTPVFEPVTLTFSGLPS